MLFVLVLLFALAWTMLSTSTLLIAAAVVVAAYVAVKLKMLSAVQIDVKVLHRVVQTVVQMKKPLPETFDIINEELAKLYPDIIVPKASRSWLLFNGGGAMGQMCILHASLTEYIIFYGSPLYSQGHSGRYLMDVYDFMIQGETKTYFPGDFVPQVYKAGEYSILPMLTAKGYCCEKESFMLEYARGIIPLALPYFICSSFFVTVDIVPWALSVWRVGKCVAYNLIFNRKM